MKREEDVEKSGKLRPDTNEGSSTIEKENSLAQLVRLTYLPTYFILHLPPSYLPCRATQLGNYSCIPLHLHGG